MVVTIHQPEHLPWLGFFNKMMNADEFIVLDTVQYRKGYFQNRNKILVNGKETYIAVPIMLKGHVHKTIADMEIYSDSIMPWKKKYLKTIEYNYKHHPFFWEYYPFFEDLLGKNIRSLSEFNMNIIKYMVAKLHIETKITFASSLSPQGSKSDLVLDISKKMQADIYLSGPSGRDYMNLPKFIYEGVEVWFNDFEHPVYTQKGTNIFIPYLSVLDLLMNVGGIEAKKIIQSGTVINRYTEIL